MNGIKTYLSSNIKYNDTLNKLKKIISLLNNTKGYGIYYKDNRVYLYNMNITLHIRYISNIYYIFVDSKLIYHSENKNNIIEYVDNLLKCNE